MIGGNVMRGISRVASTVPCVGQSPCFVCVSVVIGRSPWSRCRSAAQWEPAETAKGDEEAADTPGGHDEQVGDGEAGTSGVRVVRREQGGGEVTHGEDGGHVDQPV